MKITILNTSVLTNYGTFQFYPVSLIEAQKLVQENEVRSAVGHPATSEILTELLGVKIEVNRIEYSQEIGETALVFKLQKRAPEGKILSRDEIEEIGYGFGILRRLE